MSAVITGAALLTPWGDTPAAVLDAARNRAPPSDDLRSRDLRLADLPLPPDLRRRLDRLARRLPWSTRATLAVAVRAAHAAGWWARPPALDDVAVLVAGHNLRPHYAWESWQVFQREPDYIDPLFAVHVLDTDHAASVSELLGTRGPLGTVGASGASGHAALRAALDELADGAPAAVVLGPVMDWTPSALPARPAVHAAVALIVERADAADARGAPVLGRLGGVELGHADDPAAWRPARPGGALLLHHTLPAAPMDAALDLTPLGDPGCAAGLLGLAAALAWGGAVTQVCLGEDGLASAVYLQGAP